MSLGDYRIFSCNDLDFIHHWTTPCYWTIGKDIKDYELEEDTAMQEVIASFRYIRCNFKKHARAEQYIYESLSPVDTIIIIFINCFISCPFPGVVFKFGWYSLKIHQLQITKALLPEELRSKNLLAWTTSSRSVKQPA